MQFWYISYITSHINSENYRATLLGSPDLDLAMAVEMSQLYTDKKEVPTQQEDDEGNMTTEEK